ncbi:Scramblase [Ancylostoma caninum]|uniref:Phospholipid scramblase n=1 Tax=Ancylostoma caninum TaxID=29170 RepID=A0A368GWE2_ANCCA|nr:Scramblase [Ancylostoma caninum]
MSNMFDVYTSSGKLLFSAYERSPCLYRFVYGRQHGLTLHVTDGDGQIGYVSQICGTRLQFDVFDSTGRVARVVGPKCCALGCCGCCFPTKIYSNDGEQTGVITKHFGGFFKELCTNADVFHVEFPTDMKARGKALLLSTVFLIDYVAFEDVN